MPEFIGRPNLPNQLANTLVQLASQQSDPFAKIFDQVGKLADQYSATKLQENARQKEFERQKELKKMEIEGDLNSAVYKQLLSQDRIVSGLTRHLTSTDADALGRLSLAYVPPGQKKEKTYLQNTSEEINEKLEEKPAGIPLSSIGINLPGDPHFTPSKEKVTIDAPMAKQLGLPEQAIGVHATLDQIISMKKIDVLINRGGGGRDEARLKLAAHIVAQMPSMLNADEATIMAAIDSTYESLGVTKQTGGGTIEKPQPKEAVTKPGFSLWGFLGGGNKIPAPVIPSSTNKKKLPGID